MTPRPELLAAAVLLEASAAAVLPLSRAEAAQRRLARRSDAPASQRRRQPARDWRQTVGVAACVLVAACVAWALPGALGLAMAPVVFVGCRRALRRLPPARQPPTATGQVAAAVELVATCLEAGATPATALTLTGECMPSPLADQLTASGQALANGATAEEAVPETGALAPLAPVLRRSARTGSAMTAQLLAIAEQLRADEHFARLERARRVSVLAALPLGLCMLPAFVLLAVVPAVSGLGAGLLR